MSKQKKAIAIKLLLLLLIWSVPILGGYDDLSIILMLLILLPILILFFYRLNKNASIEKLNKVFRFFVWFFIAFYLFGLGSFLISEYPYDMPWWAMEDTLGLISPIVNLFSLGIMLKINDALVLNRKIKYCQIFSNFIKRHFGGILLIIGISILVKTIFGLFIFAPELENIVTFSSALAVVGILIEHNKK